MKLTATFFLAMATASLAAALPGATLAVRKANPIDSCCRTGCPPGFCRKRDASDYYYGDVSYSIDDPEAVAKSSATAERDAYAHVYEEYDDPNAPATGSSASKRDASPHVYEEYDDPNAPETGSSASKRDNTDADLDHVYGHYSKRDEIVGGSLASDTDHVYEEYKRDASPHVYEEYDIPDAPSTSSSTSKRDAFDGDLNHVYGHYKRDEVVEYKRGNKTTVGSKGFGKEDII